MEAPTADRLEGWVSSFYGESQPTRRSTQDETQLARYRGKGFYRGQMYGETGVPTVRCVSAGQGFRVDSGGFFTRYSSRCEQPRRFFHSPRAAACG